MFHRVRKFFLPICRIKSNCYSTKCDHVHFQKYNSCGIITLNRPNSLNALSMNMIDSLYTQLKEWDKNPEISHIIIEGGGGKAFCSGGDVLSLVESVKRNDNFVQNFFRKEYQLNYLISVLNKPYIALTDGIVMGGGVGVSIHGRYRVSTERTIWSMPEAKIGLFPDIGAGYFLSRLPHPGLGLFLGLTGHRLRGIDTVWAGTATHFVESQNLDSLKQQLVDLKFAETNTANHKKEVNQLVRKLLTDAFLPYAKVPMPKDIGCGVKHLPYLFALHDENKPTTVNTLLKRCGEFYENKNTSEDLALFTEKCYRFITQACPTSIKVTLRLLQQCSHLSLADELRLEYRIAQHMVRDPNFTEGIRALLIDKDNKPNWTPNQISSVDDNTVESYFTPIADIPEWNPQ